MAETGADPGRPLIRAAGINLRHGGRTLLDAVDLEIRGGQIITVIGPNGAGKTTLLRVLLGLLRPDQGRVTRAPGLRVGYMPQRLSVDETLPLTVERFVSMGMPRATARQRVRAVLEEVRIAHLMQQPVQAISGGETQRVLLARALLREPELLVLDEPAQGVDVGGQGELYRLIAQLRDRHGCGVLMVSHDLHLVMAAADSVLCLNQHVCCTGHPESVSRHPEYLKLFGPLDARGLAVYTHTHDHHHDLHGDVVPNEQGRGSSQACADCKHHGHNPNDEGHGHG